MPLNPAFDTWTGKRVWIVGASSGIGAALASELFARGAHVALSARNAQALATVAQEGAERALVVPLDVTDGAAVAAAAGRVAAEFGAIDLAVTVAGDYVAMRATDLDRERARRLVDTNLVGTIGVVAAVLPAMLARGAGGIAVVASVAGYRGLPRALIYGPTKAALINFAESLYLDLQPRGIGVYLVNPGFVKTRLTDRNDFPMPDLVDAPTAAREIVRGIQAGRFEIAFPRRFARVMKTLRVLPYRLYFAIVRRTTGA